METILLVLAAGMGSRYGGTKQLDTFGPSGETIIDYSIFDAIKTGFSKVVFVIRRNIEDQFRETLLKKFSGRIPVEYVFQEITDLPDGLIPPVDRVKPWGTGHAVLSAGKLLDAPFAIINADDFYGRNSFRVIHDHLVSMDASKPGACLVGFLLSQTLSEHGSVSRGICATGDGNMLTGIEEMTRIRTVNGDIFNETENGRIPLTGHEFVSMNMIGFTPASVGLMEMFFSDFIRANAQDAKAEFYIPVVLDRMIRQGVGVPVLPTDEQWVGVTYQEDRKSTSGHISKLVQDGKYPENLWA